MKPKCWWWSGPVALPSSATDSATMLLGAMATTRPPGRVCWIQGRGIGQPYAVAITLS
jgi:hypothetical protein